MNNAQSFQVTFAQYETGYGITATTIDDNFWLGTGLVGYGNANIGSTLDHINA